MLWWVVTVEVVILLVLFPGNAQSNECMEWMSRRHDGICICETQRGHNIIITCQRSNLGMIQRVLSSVVFPFKTLWLTGNEIPVLAAGCFQRLNFSHLYLTGSRIHTIHTGAFFSLENNLVHLDLSENELTMVPSSALSLLSKVKHLNLRTNNLTVIPKDAFLGMHELNTLVLENNQIHTISDSAFREVPEITTLDLDWNRLKEVPKSIRNIRNLLDLSLSYNNLKEILDPFAFAGLENSLKVLSLNGNQLEKVPPGINILNVLSTLRLGHNLIRYYKGDEFEGIKDTLTAFYLPANHIIEFPSRTLQNCDKVTLIDLSDNRIKEIREDTFIGLQNLYFLDLHKNNITKLDKNATYWLRSLRWLRLDDNNLTTVPENSFETLTHLRLELQGNPLVCNCSLEWLREQALLSGDRNFTIEGKCVSPPALAGKDFMYLNPRDFCPERYTVSPTTTTTATREPQVKRTTTRPITAAPYNSGPEILSSIKLTGVLFSAVLLFLNKHIV